jgi:hypothetical protein
VDGLSQTWAEKLVKAVERDREAHQERGEGAPPLYGPPVDLSEYSGVKQVKQVKQSRDRVAYMREYMKAYMRKRRKGDG